MPRTTSLAHGLSGRWACVALRSSASFPLLGVKHLLLLACGIAGHFAARGSWAAVASDLEPCGLPGPLGWPLHLVAGISYSQGCRTLDHPRPAAVCFGCLAPVVLGVRGRGRCVVLGRCTCAALGVAACARPFLSAGHALPWALSIWWSWLVRVVGHVLPWIVEPWCSRVALVMVPMIAGRQVPWWLRVYLLGGGTVWPALLYERVSDSWPVWPVAVAVDGHVLN